MARSNGGTGKRGSLYADLDHLRTMFASVDPANTGYIGFPELRSLVQSGAGVDETMVATVLEKLDRDQDGKISFDDFQALFVSERESIKRQRLEDSSTCGKNEDYESVLESTPREVVVSPPPLDESIQKPEVVLRHKVPLRFQRGNPTDLQLTTASSMQIGRGPTDGRSPVEHDLATQMQHLTNIPESPRISRASKVLSWISESEDMFEDAGVSEEHANSMLSPPMSPNRLSGDEENHIRSIVEAVCQTQEIGPEAVDKLCSHAEADEEEQQELLALVNHLDKQGKGYVSVDEFVSGLHSMCASPGVTPFTPPIHGKPQRHTDMPIPQLSEPFSSTPQSSQMMMAPHTSTPLPSHRKNALQGDSSQLTVLDPQNQGFVGVDTLAQQWHRMGVDPPCDQSLEDALRESLPVDASRRVSVSEVASTLETAVLHENQNYTLRQAALHTFKAEINQLRNQLHQVLMERDGLKYNLQLTKEESKRLVQEGDEQVEKITKESERKAREDEQRLNERLREVEREKDEEAKRLQELIDMQEEKHQGELEGLRNSEDRLKRELKFAMDEAKKKNIQEKLEPTVGFHGDRHDKMEVEDEESFGIRSTLDELERENTDLLEQTKNLQEENRNLKDRVDELMADNEKLKQKHTSHKRRLQRQHSAPHSSRLDDSRASTSRPHSAKRPSSASRKSTTQSSLARIIEAPIDAHQGFDTYSENDGSQEEATDEVNVESEDEKDKASDSHSSSEEGLFAKSTASLLEEMQYEDAKLFLEKELEKLRQQKQELEDTCSLLEAQLHQQQDQSDFEKKKLLSKHRHKQSELKQQIQHLEEQHRRLSITKEGIENQLEAMENNLLKQLSDIHKLQQEISSPKSSTPINDEDDYQQRIKELQRMLDTFTSEKQQLLIAHTEAMDKMQYEAEKEKERIVQIQTEHNKAIMKLTKELESSKMALEQYKNDAQSLEVQLHVLQQEVKTKERELQLSRAKQQRKVLPILPSENKEISRLKEENDFLLKDIKAKAMEIERIQELHKCEQEKYEAELKRKQQEYQEEYKRKTEDAESKISALKNRMSEEQASTKARCNIQVESTQQELKSCQLTIEKLRDRVDTAEKQSEQLLYELSQQKDLVKIKEHQLEELQRMQKTYQDEMCCIKQDKQQLELQLTQQIHQLQMKQAETKVVEEVAVMDIDCPLQADMAAIPAMSPSRQSSHSDHSYHAEIVSQMKKQLEDLQMCLIQQHTTSGKKNGNELTLVQELLEINASLKEHLQREQKERVKELAALGEKDLKMQALTESEKKHRLQENNAVMKRLEQNLQFLQQKSEECICSISDKIQAANARLMERMKKKKVCETGSRNYISRAEVSCKPKDEHLHFTQDRQRMHERDLQHSVTVKKSDISVWDKPLFTSHQTQVPCNMVQEPLVVMKNAESCHSGSVQEEDEDVIDGNETDGQLVESQKENCRKEAEQEIQGKTPEYMVHFQKAIKCPEPSTCITDLEVGEPLHKAQHTAVNETVIMMQSVDTTMQQDYAVTSREHQELKPEKKEKDAMLMAEFNKTKSQEQSQTTAQEQNSLYLQQLTSLQSEAEALKTQLYSIYHQLAVMPAGMSEVHYSELSHRAEDKIATLFAQVSEEQGLRRVVEMNMEKIQAEWQLQETQWLVEHEEEVRALRQRNLHLSQMLQDTRSQYHDYIAEQERENSDIMQDLITKQAGLESELELRTKQLSQSIIKRGNHSEQKEILVDILEQICTQGLVPSDCL